MEMIEFSLGN